MNKSIVIMLFLLTLLPICTVSGSTQLYDPNEDYYIIADETPQVAIQTDSLDLNSIEVYSNQTHITIKVTLIEGLVDYPSEPEIIDYGYVIFADNNYSRCLFFDTSVDKETGWVKFTNSIEEDKVSYSIDDSIIRYTIAKDIIDLGGSPNKILFLVWSMYENTAPIFYRIIDVAPQQEAGWMPNYLGLPLPSWNYNEVYLNETDIDDSVKAKPVDDKPESIVGNWTLYILGISLFLIIFAGYRLKLLMGQI